MRRERIQRYRVAGRGARAYMRQLLYGLAAVSLLGGALGLALLPHITTHIIWFGVLGAFFSAAGAGGWVLAGATAGDWPRPRAGWVLLIGGLVGVIVSLARSTTLPLLWAGAEAVTGLLLIVPIFPQSKQGRAQRSRRPVQAPPVTGRHEGH